MEHKRSFSIGEQSGHVGCTLISDDFKTTLLLALR